MRKLPYGTGDGEHGRKGHEALRRMTVGPSSELARGQDSLREELRGPTKQEFGPYDERETVTHSHSRVRGNMSSTPKGKS